MHKLTQYLFNTNTPLWKYILTTSMLATLPALAIAGLWQLGLSLTQLDTSRFDPPPVSTSVAGTIGTIFVSPLVETFMLAGLLAALSAVISNKRYVAMTSGLVWGALHATMGLSWFVGPAWIFFVLSCAFIAWREKGFKYAYIVSFVPHALNNALAVVTVHLL